MAVDAKSRYKPNQPAEWTVFVALDVKGLSGVVQQWVDRAAVPVAITQTPDRVRPYGTAGLLLSFQPAPAGAIRGELLRLDGILSRTFPGLAALELNGVPGHPWRFVYVPFTRPIFHYRAFEPDVYVFKFAGRTPVLKPRQQVYTNADKSMTVAYVPGKTVSVLDMGPSSNMWQLDTSYATTFSMYDRANPRRKTDPFNPDPFARARAATTTAPVAAAAVANNSNVDMDPPRPADTERKYPLPPPPPPKVTPIISSLIRDLEKVAEYDRLRVIAQSAPDLRVEVLPKKKKKKIRTVDALTIQWALSALFGDNYPTDYEYEAKGFLVPYDPYLDPNVYTSFETKLYLPTSTFAELNADGTRVFIFPVRDEASRSLIRIADQSGAGLSYPIPARFHYSTVKRVLAFVNEIVWMTVLTESKIRRGRDVFLIGLNVRTSALVQVIKGYDEWFIAPEDGHTHNVCVSKDGSKIVTSDSLRIGAVMVVDVPEGRIARMETTNIRLPTVIGIRPETNDIVVSGRSTVQPRYETRLYTSATEFRLIGTRQEEFDDSAYAALSRDFIIYCTDVLSLRKYEPNSPVIQIPLGVASFRRGTLKVSVNSQQKLSVRWVEQDYRGIRTFRVRDYQLRLVSAGMDWFTGAKRKPGWDAVVTPDDRVIDDALTALFGPEYPIDYRFEARGLLVAYPKIVSETNEYTVTRMGRSEYWTAARGGRDRLLAHVDGTFALRVRWNDESKSMTFNREVKLPGFQRYEAYRRTWDTAMLVLTVPGDGNDGPLTTISFCLLNLTTSVPGKEVPLNNPLGGSIDISDDCRFVHGHYYVDGQFLRQDVILEIGESGLVSETRVSFGEDSSFKGFRPGTGDAVVEIGKAPDRQTLVFSRESNWQKSTPVGIRRRVGCAITVCVANYIAVHYIPRILDLYSYDGRVSRSIFMDGPRRTLYGVYADGDTVIIDEYNGGTDPGKHHTIEFTTVPPPTDVSEWTTGAGRSSAVVAVVPTPKPGKFTVTFRPAISWAPARYQVVVSLPRPYHPYTAKKYPLFDSTRNADVTLKLPAGIPENTPVQFQVFEWRLTETRQLAQYTVGEGQTTVKRLLAMGGTRVGEEEKEESTGGARDATAGGSLETAAKRKPGWDAVVTPDDRVIDDALTALFGPEYPIDYRFEARGFLVANPKIVSETNEYTVAVVYFHNRTAARGGRHRLLTYAPLKSALRVRWNDGPNSMSFDREVKLPGFQRYEAYRRTWDTAILAHMVYDNWISFCLLNLTTGKPGKEVRLNNPLGGDIDISDDCRFVRGNYYVDGQILRPDVILEIGESGLVSETRVSFGKVSKFVGFRPGVGDAVVEIGQDHNRQTVVFSRESKWQQSTPVDTRYHPNRTAPVDTRYHHKHIVTVCTANYIAACHVIQRRLDLYSYDGRVSQSIDLEEEELGRVFYNVYADGDTVIIEYYAGEDNLQEHDVIEFTTVPPPTDVAEWTTGAGRSSAAAGGSLETGAKRKPGWDAVVTPDDRVIDDALTALFGPEYPIDYRYEAQGFLHAYPKLESSIKEYDVVRPKAHDYLTTPARNALVYEIEYTAVGSALRVRWNDAGSSSLNREVKLVGFQKYAIYSRQRDFALLVMMESEYKYGPTTLNSFCLLNLTTGVPGKVSRLVRSLGGAGELIVSSDCRRIYGFYYTGFNGTNSEFEARPVVVELSESGIQSIVRVSFARYTLVSFREGTYDLCTDTGPFPNRRITVFSQKSNWQQSNEVAIRWHGTHAAIRYTANCIAVYSIERRVLDLYSYDGRVNQSIDITPDPRRFFGMYVDEDTVIIEFNTNRPETHVLECTTRPPPVDVSEWTTGAGGGGKRKADESGSNGTPIVTPDNRTIDDALAALFGPEYPIDYRYEARGFLVAYPRIHGDIREYKTIDPPVPPTEYSPLGCVIAPSRGGGFFYLETRVSRESNAVKYTYWNHPDAPVAPPTDDAKQQRHADPRWIDPRWATHRTTIPPEFADKNVRVIARNRNIALYAIETASPIKNESPIIRALVRLNLNTGRFGAAIPLSIALAVWMRTYVSDDCRLMGGYGHADDVLYVTELDENTDTVQSTTSIPEVGHGVNVSGFRHDTYDLVTYQSQYGTYVWQMHTYESKWERAVFITDRILEFVKFIFTRHYYVTYDTRSLELVLHSYDNRIHQTISMGKGPRDDGWRCSTLTCDGDVIIAEYYMWINQVLSYRMVEMTVYPPPVETADWITGVKRKTGSDAVVTPDDRVIDDALTALFGPEYPIDYRFEARGFLVAYPVIHSDVKEYKNVNYYPHSYYTSGRQIIRPARGGMCLYADVRVATLDDGYKTAGSVYWNDPAVRVGPMSDDDKKNRLRRAGKVDPRWAQKSAVLPDGYRLIGLSRAVALFVTDMSIRDANMRCFSYLHLDTGRFGKVMQLPFAVSSGHIRVSDDCRMICARPVDYMTADEYVLELDENGGTVRIRAEIRRGSPDGFCHGSYDLYPVVPDTANAVDCALTMPDLYRLNILTSASEWQDTIRIADVPLWKKSVIRWVFTQYYYVTYDEQSMVLTITSYDKRIRREVVLGTDPLDGRGPFLSLTSDEDVVIAMFGVPDMDSFRTYEVTVYPPPVEPADWITGSNGANRNARGGGGGGGGGGGRSTGGARRSTDSAVTDNPLAVTLRVANGHVKGKLTVDRAVIRGRVALGAPDPKWETRFPFPQDLGEGWITGGLKPRSAVAQDFRRTHIYMLQGERVPVWIFPFLKDCVNAFSLTYLSNALVNTCQWFGFKSVDDWCANWNKPECMARGIEVLAQVMGYDDWQRPYLYDKEKINGTWKIYDEFSMVRRKPSVASRAGDCEDFTAGLQKAYEAILNIPSNASTPLATLRSIAQGFCFSVMDTSIYNQKEKLPKSPLGDDVNKVALHMYGVLHPWAMVHAMLTAGGHLTHAAQLPEAQVTRTATWDKLSLESTEMNVANWTISDTATGRWVDTSKSFAHRDVIAKLRWHTPGKILKREQFYRMNICMYSPALCALTGVHSWLVASRASRSEPWQYGAPMIDVMQYRAGKQLALQPAGTLTEFDRKMIEYVQERIPAPYPLIDPKVETPVAYAQDANLSVVLLFTRVEEWSAEDQTKFDDAIAARYVYAVPRQMLQQQAEAAYWVFQLRER